MKKQVLSLICLLMIFCLLLVGCDIGFGTKYVSDPAEYGRWESYLDVPSFFPDSIDAYEVNVYSYTLYAYMDICYEIFLDITVSEEQMAQLIASAKSAGSCYEQAAYYADGYRELVFCNEYALHPHPDEDDVPRVWQANVKKVIYNLQTNNIIYVDLFCFDSGVYELKDVEYFARFGIKEAEYVAHITPNTQER